MNRILFDTNAYSQFLKGNKRVRELLEASSQVCFSIIVIAELFVGFENGNQPKKNYEILNDFLSEARVETFQVTQETAEVYKDIYLTLKKQGTPIPTNDIWIAAQSIELGAKLLTFDQHFKHIPGLRIEHISV